MEPRIMLDERPPGLREIIEKRPGGNPPKGYRGPAPFRFTAESAFWVVIAIFGGMLGVIVAFGIT